jgi:hypothetical protein
MFIKSWAARLLSITIIAGFFSMSVTGCVSSGTYEGAKKEAQSLKRELAQERVKREAIEKTYAERRKLMENITESWSDLRNEITMLRVNHEWERQQGICGIGMVLEGDAPSTTAAKPYMDPTLQ